MTLQSNLLSLQLITRNYASFRQRLLVFYIGLGHDPILANLSFLSDVSNLVSLYYQWKRLRNRYCKELKKIFDELLICFQWNIWLERNNIIFQSLQRSAIQITQLVKDQITQLVEDQIRSFSVYQIELVYVFLFFCFFFCSVFWRLLSICPLIYLRGKSFCRFFFLKKNLCTQKKCFILIFL